MALILFALVVRAASAEEQADEKENWGAWLKERLTHDGQALPMATFQQPADSPQNPANALAKLASRDYALHLRPNFAFRAGDVSLGIRPRLIADYAEILEGRCDGDTDSGVDVFINEWYAEWRIAPSFVASVERRNLQWGSGFITSPSNPFYRVTGKTRPQEELAGKDFVIASWIPNDMFSLTAMANVAEGEYEEAGSRESFKETYALKATITLENSSLSPVVSYQNDDRLRVGGFGSWTASDAVVLFFDASFAQGSNGRYVTNVENDPFGSAFAQAKDDDGTLRAEILLGGSYTFTEGTTVSAEYLYYGEGYDNDEADDFYALLNRSGAAFAYQGDDAARQQLAQLATRNLYYAQQSNLAFRRRHYAMLYANRDDLWDRLGVTGGVMVNANDQSFYAFANSSLKIVDALESFVNILTYSRENDTEFHGLFDYMATVGLRWYF